MLFYTALFIACTVTALVALKVYRTITRAGQAIRASRAVSETILPSAAHRRAQDRRPGQVALQTSANKASTRQPQRNTNLNKPVSAMALGSPESWTCKNEEFEFAGKTYKVKRQALPERSGKRKTNRRRGA